jgi:DoxX-like family
MARKVIYWVSTGLLAAMSVFAAFAYLSGSPQAVQGFAHVGYPQQLRIILGIAKLLGAITLIVPGLPKLKEWPMPDSHSPGPRHLSRIIWLKTARKHSHR